MNDKPDVLGQLDARISAIQSHRSWRESEAAKELEELDAAWEQVLEAARALRGRLRDHPQLRYFTIARDHMQVAVSFHLRGGGGSDLLSLHRFHPDGKFPNTQVIWSRAPGELDGRHKSGQAVVDLLVRHCARHLSAR